MQTSKISVGRHIMDMDARTYIMGILNATPDSFSDGGNFMQVDRAIDHVAEMIEYGADLIDVGGESTRPGAQYIAAEEELERVIPVIEALASRFDVPLSIDTYKADVAEQALQAGAHIINDVWGAKADPHMASVAAKTKAPIILMHNRKERDYTNLMDDIIVDMEQSILISLKAGVQASQIILDPGIGFAKTWQDNLVVMNHLERLIQLGYPVLLGTSRKSMIGKILDLPAEERVEGTIATVCLGITKGCHIVRVHDVKEVTRAVKVMDAMLGKGIVLQHG
ncbi:dihydropteroate synthase [Bacillus horti]|uniref:Dihydropteroate synthase n=1 Tax=Caldalkalibacillus horti TaxID=77523 RepID=A0ABT9W3G6_9BACI|nr:dihydropteroate synthase [Bacillus horti]MDQ0167614.1 dihydropteroate synthase [Bacillus horti]